MIEFPVLIAALFQLHSDSEVASKFIKFTAEALAIPPEDVRSVASPSRFADFVLAQVKAASLAAFFCKTCWHLAQPYAYSAGHVVLLLEFCPPEALTARKELLICLRHLFCSEMRPLFAPHLDRLLSSRVLYGQVSIFPALRTLKPLSLSALADLVHPMRPNLTEAQTRNTCSVFISCLRDQSLPWNIQAMIIRFLLALIETPLATVLSSPAALFDAKLGSQDVIFQILSALADFLEALLLQLPSILTNVSSRYEASGRMRSVSVWPESEAEPECSLSAAATEISGRQALSLLGLVFSALNFSVPCVLLAGGPAAHSPTMPQLLILHKLFRASLRCGVQYVSLHRLVFAETFDPEHAPLVARAFLSLPTPIFATLVAGSIHLIVELAEHDPASLPLLECFLQFDRQSQSSCFIEILFKHWHGRTPSSLLSPLALSCYRAILSASERNENPRAGPDSFPMPPTWTKKFLAFCFDQAVSANPAELRGVFPLMRSLFLQFSTTAKVWTRAAPVLCNFFMRAFIGDPAAPPLHSAVHSGFALSIVAANPFNRRQFAAFLRSWQLEWARLSSAPDRSMLGQLRLLKHLFHKVPMQFGLFPEMRSFYVALLSRCLSENRQAVRPAALRLLRAQPRTLSLPPRRRSVDEASSFLVEMQGLEAPRAFTIVPLSQALPFAQRLLHSPASSTGERLQVFSFITECIELYLDPNSSCTTSAVPDSHESLAPLRIHNEQLARESLKAPKSWITESDTLRELLLTVIMSAEGELASEARAYLSHLAMHFSVLYLTMTSASRSRDALDPLSLIDALLLASSSSHQAFSRVGDRCLADLLSSLVALAGSADGLASTIFVRYLSERLLSMCYLRNLDTLRAGAEGLLALATLLGFPWLSTFGAEALRALFFSLKSLTTSVNPSQSNTQKTVSLVILAAVSLFSTDLPSPMIKILISKLDDSTSSVRETSQKCFETLAKIGHVDLSVLFIQWSPLIDDLFERMGSSSFRGFSKRGSFRVPPKAVGIRALPFLLQQCPNAISDSILAQVLTRALPKETAADDEPRLDYNGVLLSQLFCSFSRVQSVLSQDDKLIRRLAILFMLNLRQRSKKVAGLGTHGISILRDCSSSSQALRYTLSESHGRLDSCEPKKDAAFSADRRLAAIIPSDSEQAPVALISSLSTILSTLSSESPVNLNGKVMRVVTMFSLLPAFITASHVSSFLHLFVSLHEKMAAIVPPGLIMVSNKLARIISAHLNVCLALFYDKLGDLQFSSLFLHTLEVEPTLSSNLQIHSQLLLDRCFADSGSPHFLEGLRIIEILQSRGQNILESSPELLCALREAWKRRTAPVAAPGPGWLLKACIESQLLGKILVFHAMKAKVDHGLLLTLFRALCSPQSFCVDAVYRLFTLDIPRTFTMQDSSRLIQYSLRLFSGEEFPTGEEGDEWKASWIRHVLHPLISAHDPESNMEDPLFDCVSPLIVEHISTAQTHAPGLRYECLRLGCVMLDKFPQRARKELRSLSRFA